MKIKKIFKIISLVLVVILAAIVLDLDIIACSNIADVDGGGGGDINSDFNYFTIDPVGVNIDESKNLTITSTPSDGVTYTAISSDTGIADVTVSGDTVTVTGKTAGTVTVSVTAKKAGYNDKTVDVPVTVTDPILPDFTALAISPTSVEVKTGESKNLTITSTPSDGVTYTAISSDTSKVKVEVIGSTVKVTGKTPSTGTVTVSVTAKKAGYNDKTVDVPVTVTDPILPDFTALTISPTSVEVKAGESKNLTITSTPSDGVTYTATSSDTGTADVTVSGDTVTVTGKAAGTVTVSVTAKKDGYNDKTVDVPVTVTDPILPDFTTLTISPTSVEVKAGESQNLTITSTPSDGVTYTAISSDTTKVKVEVIGSTVKVTGKTPSTGTVTVSVTAKKDGYNSKTVTANVIMKPSDFTSFSIAPTSVGIGKSKKLTINIEPSDGVTYSATSNDTGKIGVTASGGTVTVTGNSSGWTKVKVTAKKAGYNDKTIEVSVAAVNPVPLTMIRSIEMGGSTYVYLECEVAQTEITQKQYKDVLEWAKNSEMSWVSSEYPEYDIEKAVSSPSYFSSDPASGETQENRPVEQVTWYDAVMYCNLLTMMEMGAEECVYSIKDVSYNRYDKYSNITNATVELVSNWDDLKGYRLPYEIEWEIAAKCGKDLRYAGTDGRVDDYAWYKDNSGMKTHEVKQKKPNACGLYDMTGNVSEWCWDIGVPNIGASYLGLRAERGGSWDSDTQNLLVTPKYKDRAIKNLQQAFNYLGFRVVRNILF